MKKPRVILALLAMTAPALAQLPGGASVAGPIGGVEMATGLPLIVQQTGNPASQAALVCGVANGQPDPARVLFFYKGTFYPTTLSYAQTSLQICKSCQL